jgi:hypothetical protein
VQAATRWALHAVLLHQLRQHKIRRLHKIWIAAHVINAPGEIARIAQRNIANGESGVATECEEKLACRFE